jgi:hypothetical protein
VDQRKQKGALLIAACIVVAIRLRREPIRPLPKLYLHDFRMVRLARLVMREIER